MKDRNCMHKHILQIKLITHSSNKTNLCQFKTAISNANQHLLSRHIIYYHLKLFKGTDGTNCFKLQTLELWWPITVFDFDDRKERVATSAIIYFINLADENWHLLYPSNQIWVRNSWLLQAFLPCVLSLSPLCLLCNCYQQH